MPRPKGIPKTGGRQKGVTNVVTSQIKDSFQLLIDNNIDRLQDDLNALEPLERLNMIIQFAKFIIPTMKATESNIEIANKIIEIDFTE